MDQKLHLHYTSRQFESPPPGTIYVGRHQVNVEASVLEKVDEITFVDYIKKDANDRASNHI